MKNINIFSIFRVPYLLRHNEILVRSLSIEVSDERALVMLAKIIKKGRELKFL